MLTFAHSFLPQGWTSDISGFIASAFVLATFCMSSMLWLRIVAIASNFAFIYDATTVGLLPVLVLHTILVPVNEPRRARAADSRRPAVSPPAGNRREYCRRGSGAKRARRGKVAG